MIGFYAALTVVDMVMLMEFKDEECNLHWHHFKSRRLLNNLSNKEVATFCS